MENRYHRLLRRHLPVMASRSIGPVSLVFIRRGAAGHGWLGINLLFSGQHERSPGPLYGFRVATIVGDINVEWGELA